MTNFNNINGFGIGLNTNMPQKEQTAQAPKEEIQAAPQVKSDLNLISGEEVLSVMAQQAALNKSAINAPKSYDVSKYVTQEQAQRIAGFVTSFEDTVAKNLQSVNTEFGSMLSDEAKMNIVLAAADKMAS